MTRVQTKIFEFNEREALVENEDFSKQLFMK